jgi:hypothetical protein
MLLPRKQGLDRYSWALRRVEGYGKVTAVTSQTDAFCGQKRRASGCCCFHRRSARTLSYIKESDGIASDLEQILGLKDDGIECLEWNATAVVGYPARK